MAADFQALADLGANAVTISHAGIFTEEPDANGQWQLDEAIAGNLDRLLDLALDAGLYATIAFRTGPGRNEFTFLSEEDPGWLGRSLDYEALWTDAAAQAAWAEMLRAAAQRYGNHPAVVAIDLIVEPNPHKSLCDFCGPEEFEAQFGGTISDWNNDLPAVDRGRAPGRP